MKKGVIFLNVLFFLLMSNSVFAQGLTLKEFKPGSEPDGFKGIKWGKDISTVQGMFYVRSHLQIENKAYIRKNGNPEIDDVRADSIIYYFWADKFYMALVEISGYENFLRIKDTFLEKYGSQEPLEFAQTEPQESMIAYGWQGPKTKIFLHYSKPLNMTSIKIMSVEVNRQAPR